MGFPYNVFISYRCIDPDMSWVREQLDPRLRQAGIKVCLDIRDFKLGREKLKEMTRAVNESGKILSVITPSYFKGNGFAEFELLLARSKDPAGIQSKIIPLILIASNLPDWITGIVRIDWTRENNLRNEWQKLLKELGATRKSSHPSFIENNQQTDPETNKSKTDNTYLDTEGDKSKSFDHSFTGRNDELNLLETKLAEGFNVLWLCGNEGIGKTSLALEFAKRMCDSKGYEKTFSVDLKGNTKKALKADEVRSRIINELQPGTFLPSRSEKLTFFYNDIIAGRKIVLILDNARDPGQISDLFSKHEKSQWLIIVTSRTVFEMNMSGVFCFQVDKLKNEDAKSFLENIIPPFESYLDTVATLCDNMPLALLWAGKFMRKLEREKYGEYINKLKNKIYEINSFNNFNNDEAKNLASRVLSVNYEYLVGREDERKRLVDLAIFQSTFDIEALARIWHLDKVKAARRYLKRFLDLSLVEYNKHTGRYSLHDSAQLFLKKYKDPDRHEKNKKIFATHFMEILKKLNTDYIKGGDNFKKSRTLFDLEWDNIQDGYGIAEKGFDEGEPDFKKVCVSYPIAGFDILCLRQDTNKRIDWIKKGIKIAQELSLRDDLGILKGLYALALRHKGTKDDILKSIVLLDDAINIAGCNPDCKKWKGIHLSNRGNAYAVLGDFEQANKDYTEAKTVFKDILDRTGESIVLNNQARVLINLGETIKACELCREALNIAEETSDIRRKAGAYSNMGIIQRHFGQINDSIDYHEKALQIFRELGDRLWVGITLCLLGRAYMDQEKNEIKKGFDQTREAKKIFEDFGEKRWEGIAIGNLGIAKIRLGELHEAIELIRSALKIAEDTGDERRRAIHKNCLGQAYLKLGNIEKSIEYNETALGSARLLKDKRRQVGALLSLGTARYLSKDSFAVENVRDAKVLSEEIGDKRREAQCNHYLGLIERDSNNLAEARKSLTKALKISKTINAPFSADIEKDLSALPPDPA